MHYEHRRPKHHELKGNDTLYVIAVISNPVQYHSRYRLYEQFARHMAMFPEVRLVTVEHAFGDRHHEITQDSNSSHVQVRGNHEIWLKENLINIGIRSLPHNWRYVAWIDADVTFLNPNWARETLHALQHYHVVQPFENANDLGPHNNILKTYQGFAKQCVTGAARHVVSSGYYYGAGAAGEYWHPGFAWAARREFINNVGGLIDFGIVGAGDHHMALSIIGEGHRSVPKGLHPNYLKRILEWQDKALKSHTNLGYVRGSILHHWHGPKKQRKYYERWKVLINNGFNPNIDLAYDAQGLLHLTCPHKTKLRDELRAYFRQRNEDSRDED